MLSNQLNNFLPSIFNHGASTKLLSHMSNVHCHSLNARFFCWAVILADGFQIVAYQAAGGLAPLPRSTVLVSACGKFCRTMSARSLHGVRRRATAIILQANFGARICDSAHDLKISQKFLHAQTDADSMVLLLPIAGGRNCLRQK